MSEFKEYDMSEETREFALILGGAALIGLSAAVNLHSLEPVVTAIALLGLSLYCAALYLFKNERWFWRIRKHDGAVAVLSVGLVVGDALWIGLLAPAAS